MIERGVALSAFISFQRPLPIGSLRGQDWPNKRKIGSHILQVGTLPAWKENLQKARNSITSGFNTKVYYRAVVPKQICFGVALCHATFRNNWMPSDDPTRWKLFGWMCGLIIAFLQNKMKELDLKEKSSKSLLANVLDMDDDYRPSSALPQVLFCQAKSFSNYSLCQKILMPLTFNKIQHNYH